MEKMYFEKLTPILEDLENKEVEIAGGSVVGMVLSITNSLITYIGNLTKDKKKYENVKEEVLEILEKSNNLKQKALKGIDKDKEVLEKILIAYKAMNNEENNELKKEKETEYIKVCKDAVEFCLDVLNTAFETLKLSDNISKVGNRMLASDFKICKYYSYASVQAAIVNVEINLNSIDDEKYKNEVKEKYEKIIKLAEEYMK